MESLMCQIEKMMNHQLGGKMNKDVFRFQYFERGTKKKNWTHHLSYTINSHEAFDTADPDSLQDVYHIRAQ